MTDPNIAALARIRQMAGYWEQHLPEVIRTPAVVSALRAALEPAAVEPSVDRPALRQRAEAALSAVEAALGDTLVPAAREEALAGIAAVLPPPADRAPTIPSQADTGPGDESPHVYMDAVQDSAAWAYAFTKAGQMTEALEHVEAIERLLAVYRRAVGAQDGATPVSDLAAADSPTPLRWGLDDVLHGDDDTTTILLSGPGGAPYWLELEPERAAALRDALARPGGEATEQQPRRGDAFERWLKAQRDEHRDTGRGVWTTLDNLLDAYRLHADTGTPLDEHVCEGQAVGDCECLEQPVTGARDGAAS